MDTKDLLELRDRSQQSVVFFDDLCVLCSGTVSFLIKIDSKKRLRYSSLTGEFIRSLGELELLSGSPSVVVWSDGKFYLRSAALIHLLKQLGGIYRVFGIALNLLPRFVLDVLYNLIARNRYRIFGKKDVCFMPSPDLRSLFIP